MVTGFLNGYRWFASMPIPARAVFVMGLLVAEVGCIFIVVTYGGLFGNFQLIRERLVWLLLSRVVMAIGIAAVVASILTSVTSSGFSGRAGSSATIFGAIVGMGIGMTFGAVATGPVVDVVAVLASLISSGGHVSSLAVQVFGSAALIGYLTGLVVVLVSGRAGLVLTMSSAGVTGHTVLAWGKRTIIRTVAGLGLDVAAGAIVVGAWLILSILFTSVEEMSFGLIILGANFCLIGAIMAASGFFVGVLGASIGGLIAFPIGAAAGRIIDAIGKRREDQ